MDMMGLFADHAEKAWADLPDLVRSTLDRNGFDAAQSDAVRKVSPYQPAPGATFLRAKEIADVVGRDLGERYQAMLLRETRYAVPEATVAHKRPSEATYGRAPSPASCHATSRSSKASASAWSCCIWGRSRVRFGAGRGASGLVCRGAAAHLNRARRHGHHGSQGYCRVP